MAQSLHIGIYGPFTAPTFVGLCDVLWPQGMCLCDVMHSMVYIAHMSLCIMQQAGAIGLSQSLGLQPWNPSDLVVLQCDAPHSWTTMLPSITHNIHACMGLAYFAYLFTIKNQPSHFGKYTRIPWESVMGNVCFPGGSRMPHQFSEITSVSLVLALWVPWRPHC